jgi:hypothetical protein
MTAVKKVDHAEAHPHDAVVAEAGNDGSATARL